MWRAVVAFDIAGADLGLVAKVVDKFAHPDGRVRRHGCYFLSTLHWDGSGK